MSTKTITTIATLAFALIANVAFADTASIDKQIDNHPYYQCMAEFEHKAGTDWCGSGGCQWEDGTTVDDYCGEQPDTLLALFKQREQAMDAALLAKQARRDAIELHIGVSTAEDVIAKYGKPSGTTRTTTALGTVEQMAYSNRVILLTDGVVTVITDWRN